MTGQSGQFAHTRANAQALAAHDRRNTLDRVMQLINDGQPGFAEFTLTLSVMRQAHLFGAALTGTPEIVPASPKSRGRVRVIHVDRLGRARVQHWTKLSNTQKENTP